MQPYSNILLNLNEDIEQMCKQITIQSLSDIITNSSSEVFIVSKEDMLHYVERYDEGPMDCFTIQKLNWVTIKSEEWTSYDITDSEDIPYEYVLHLLRISEEDAMREGLKLIQKEYECCNGNVERYLTPIDNDDKLFGDDWDTPEKKKERRDATIEFHKSWCEFCKNHHDDIKEKVIGKYVMEVEDHFYDYVEFKEEIDNKGYFYHESRH